MGECASIVNSEKSKNKMEIQKKTKHLIINQCTDEKNFQQPTQPQKIEDDQDDVFNPKNSKSKIYKKSNKSKDSTILKVSKVQKLIKKQEKQVVQQQTRDVTKYIQQCQSIIQEEQQQEYQTDGFQQFLCRDDEEFQQQLDSKMLRHTVKMEFNMPKATGGPLLVPINCYEKYQIKYTTLPFVQN